LLRSPDIERSGERGSQDPQPKKGQTVLDLVYEMITAKAMVNMYRKDGDKVAATYWDVRHDEIHRQLKDLLYLDGLIGAVVW